jgi:hypothetical protein
MREEGYALNLQPPDEGNPTNFVVHQFIKSICLVDEESERFSLAFPHDGIHPFLCLRGDESKGEKVGNVQQRDKPFLFIATACIERPIKKLEHTFN